MPNQFFSPEGDIEKYFITDSWLIDQYIGDRLWVWGNGLTGTLGNATTDNRSTPVTTFIGGTNWKQISSGTRHSVGIKTDGTLWTWGRNLFGQLGNAVTDNRSTPVTTFIGGTDWKQASAGPQSSAAVKTDGTLWTWGLNDNGQLGTGDLTNKSTPIQTFVGGTIWNQVSIGRRVSAAVQTDGSVWTWGNGVFIGRLTVNSNLDSLSNIVDFVATPTQTFVGGTNWRENFLAEESTNGAIKMDGTLWMWGNNPYGKLGNATTQISISTPVTTFLGGTNWRQISTSEYNHSAAIKTDGTLWTWGFNSSGQLGNATFADRSTPVTTFLGGTNWRQVSVGKFHTAAVKTDGTLWTWGGGSYGKLGNAAAVNRSTPVTTFRGGNHTAQTGWIRVSCGEDHTIGITSAVLSGGLDRGDLVWSWGKNTLGQLGITDFSDRSTPVTIFLGGLSWSSVSAGNNFSAAIEDGGGVQQSRLWLWGDNTDGKLGIATFGGNRSTPVTTFRGGTYWKQVSTGRDGCAGIHYETSLGNYLLWTWGNGLYGQNGNNTTNNVSTPVTASFSRTIDWMQISRGDVAVVGIVSDFGGSTGIGATFLYAFGRNDLDHALGLPDFNLFPQPISGISSVKLSNVRPLDYFQIASAGHTKAAIKNDGTLWMWGNNYVGNLGINEIGNFRSTPVTTFLGGTNWKQISLNSNNGIRPSAAAIKTDGTLWTWGYSNYGKMGNANNFNPFTPITTFLGGTNWKQVSCGYFHNAAVKTDGTLWTWGQGTYGQLGNAATTSRSTPVTTFLGGTNWKEVVCGGFFVDGYTLATKTDGTLWAWGNGINGQLGNATTSNRSTPVTTFIGGTNWKQVACQGAIKTDGTLWMWGNAIDGQLGNGDLNSKSTPVTTFLGGTNWVKFSRFADSSSSAIKSDGTLWVWGLNNATNKNLGIAQISILIVSTPVTTFFGGTNWSQSVTGSAIKIDGTLWTWGGSNGSLGNATIDTSISTPVTTFIGGNTWGSISNLIVTSDPTTYWKSVSCGSDHTVGIKTDATLWVWGNGAFGALGTADTINRTTPVTTFLGGSYWKQVSCGTTFTSAIKNDATLWTWGFNSSGQLGNADTTNTSTPVTTFIGGTNWKQVSVGYRQSAAIKTDGTLWTWGGGSVGALGNATTTDRSTPVTTSLGGNTWRQVGVGSDFMSAVTSGIPVDLPLA